MPELGSTGAPESRDIELKMIKGPENSYLGNLIISEAASISDDNVFDFVCRAYISTNHTPPRAD